jgi:outer membrane protein OmpA-like peptidoglycan-associated protein
MRADNGQSPMTLPEENPPSKEPESNNSDLEKSDSWEGLLDLLFELQLTEQNQSFTTPSDSPEKIKSDEEEQKDTDWQNSSEQPEKKTPQTNPDLSNLRQSIANLAKKLEKLEHQIYEPTELINPILPLITELLNIKGIESRESLLKNLVPIIDEAIQQRSQLDLLKMGGAIANILPTAISHEIQNSPTEIAKAIAPEIAMAIQEQIRLDRDSISSTLGPEMGEAIKTQILVEKDAMVDALYPVIGSTISKYMVELVKSINEKVESAFSFEGIKRKIRAKIQGVSEAELILQEAINYEVQAVFLIHKASGLVIREIHPSLELRLEADMLAGLLTAIRSFVNECIAPPGGESELHEIEYDASKIILEVAGYCYLAVVVRGEPSKQFIERLEKTLGQIVLQYGKLIAAYDGDPVTIPNSIEKLLEKLAKTEAQEKASKPPYALLLLVSSIILIWGFVLYRAHVANRIETQTNAALDAAPELSVYRLTTEVHHGQLTLAGKVPNDYLKDKAGKIASQVAPNLKLDNQIIAVSVPPDPVLTAGEIERVTWIFNRKEGVAINTRHEYGTKTVTVEGIVPDLTEAEQITQAFQQIPGVESVTNTVQIRPILETRIYFESGSTQYASSDISAQIRAIRQFLEQNPRVHLRIIGHTDYRGGQSSNQELGIRRARMVQQALIAEQINPARLHISGSTELPPGVTADRPLWLSRCVRFEVFIP